jgi:hypothetical protein
MPDFAERRDGKFIPAIGKLLEDEVDGSVSYNSARFPWHLGTEYIIYGDKRAYDQLIVMNTWIRKATAGDPSKIASGYKLDGAILPGRNYADLAFQSPFMVSAMADISN